MGMLYGWTPDVCLAMPLPRLLMFFYYGREYEGLRRGMIPAARAIPAQMDKAKRRLPPEREDKPDRNEICRRFKVTMVKTA